MRDQFYRIIKCSQDGDGSLLSEGYLPGKFVSIEQADLKIKTLDPNYQYIVETEFIEDKFYKSTTYFQIRFYHPCKGVTIDTTLDKQKTELWICGDHLDTFDTYQECKEALVTLGIPLDGLD